MKFRERRLKSFLNFCFHEFFDIFYFFQQQQNQNRGGGAWWDRMKSLASTTSFRSTENIPQLKQDIRILEELSRQLFLEIHDLINMRERLDWSKTWQGKYFNFLGYFFSIYCTWKIFIR